MDSTKKIQRLEGYSTLADVAKRLHLAGRQGAHYVVLTSGAFDVDDIRYIEQGHQPIYLVRTSALDAEVVRRGLVEEPSSPVRVTAE